MKLLVPSEIRKALASSLRSAGNREIGGILMGEALGEDVFRLKEVTIQFHGGTFAAFVRVVQDFIAPLRNFFQKYNNEYRRFNYMGEWHSHHSFALRPSLSDHGSMFDIVHDASVGANFVVLVLLKLRDDVLVGEVFVYTRHSHPFRGTIQWES